MSHNAQLAVLFADVASSTELYDTLGDDKARRIIARCVAVMTDATNRHGGTLIKTIGDEAMSTFVTAAAAADAAVEMQEAITGDMRADGRRLAIRIGFHFGPVLWDDGDVFGDTVNVAGRLVHYAKPGQIVTTGETVATLTGPMNAQCRQIDFTQVKGKYEALTIHELVWQAEDATIMSTLWALKQDTGASLVLTTGLATRLELNSIRPTVTLGRGDQNDLVVGQACVSRLHARIDYRKGRFVLTDLSTNGTYVLAKGSEVRLVRRDSHELTTSGILSLGEDISRDSPVAIKYELV
jgi:adenylate cyclase